MKAVQFDHYGDLDVLYVGDIPAPTAEPGQVVVDIRAAGINIGESVIRKGEMQEAFPLTFPSGQGWDCAGVVSAVGEGVGTVAVGDEVICRGLQHASQAEQVALSADQVIPKPPELSWEVAGSLFVVGTTACAAVHAVNAGPSDTVAVSAAAGGVGSLVVQMLRRIGANVIGIASERNHAWLRSVGAVPVAHGDGLADRLRGAAPNGIDAFIDCFGDGYCQLAIDLGISPERINTIVDFGAAQTLHVKAEASAQASSPPIVSEIAEMVASGEVVIPIDATYPFRRDLPVGAGARSLYRVGKASHPRQACTYPVIQRLNVWSRSTLEPSTGGSRGERKAYEMFTSTATRFKPGLKAAMFKILLTVTVALALLTPSHVQAQAANLSDLKALQNTTNTEPGPRSVPAKVLPVPDDVSPAARALIAEPYWFPFWDAHPASAKAWRTLVKELADGSLPGLAELRDALGVTLEQTTMGGVNCYVLTPKTVPAAHRNQLVINMHGGAYVFGPGESGTLEATLMAAYGGYRVISPDYRMPPGAPYPAALDDAMAVWKAALATHDPRHLAIFGTSTGGGLTLAMILRAKREGLALPAAIAPYSPWADLTATGDSYKVNEGVDNILVSYDGYLGRAALLYADGHDLKDPLLSPVYGNFSGFPPTLLMAGTRDLFLSNTVRTQRKLRRARVRAELQMFEGLSHAQFLFDPVAPETKEIFAEVTAFFDEHLAK